MVELLRTNDPVLISFLTAFLKTNGLEAIVLDFHTSVLEGSANAIPRRVMIDDKQENRARYLLREAGTDHDARKT